jgi:hypothetical protein
MPDGSANLMERLYDLLTEVYASTAGDSAFLAFEKLGVPISPGMFKLAPGDTTLSPPLAVERLSEIANAVLTVQGDSVERSSRSIDDMVEMLLLQAMPLRSDQLASFGATKDAASKNFDDAQAALSGPFQYHPVYASPVDWYDPSAGGNWTTHAIGQQQTQTTTPPPTSPPRPVQVSAANWRVLPTALQPALAQPVGETHPLLTSSALKTTAAATGARAQPAPAPAPHVMMTSMVARPVSTAAAAAFRPTAVAATPAAAAAAPRPATSYAAMQMYRPMMAAQASAQLSAGATTRPVTTSSIGISFDHCVVTLTRHWFPEVFLLTKNWYAPGYAAGSFSGGKGAGDEGLLPLVATGFVAVRNLRISANWSADEQATVQGSAAFGPFSLIGRSYDAASGTITCPGMQIIGWFLETLPVAPPAGDPQLAPAAAPTTATAGTGSTPQSSSAPAPATTPSSASTPSGVPSNTSPQASPNASASSAAPTLVTSNPGG